MSYLFFILLVFASILFKLYYPTIKGKVGETKVKKVLEHLDKNLYITFHDLYISIEHGKKTSQVDHIVLSSKGIFVIETKNYKGWITGSEQAQYWNQTNYKRKDKFKNPIWQNYGHIKALKAYLGDIAENIPYYSIIVFGDQAELKFKTDFKNATVIKRNRLLEVIKGSSDGIALNPLQLKNIQKKIEKLTTITHEEKNKLAKAHKTEIRSTLSHQKNQIKENVCPKCGNQLVVRKGKYGTFKGCSSYPKCKFTA